MKTAVISRRVQRISTGLNWTQEGLNGVDTAPEVAIQAKESHNRARPWKYESLHEGKGKIGSHGSDFMGQRQV